MRPTSPPPPTGPTCAGSPTWSASAAPAGRRAGLGQGRGRQAAPIPCFPQDRVAGPGTPARQAQTFEVAPTPSSARSGTASPRPGPRRLARGPLGPLPRRSRVPRRRPGPVRRARRATSACLRSLPTGLGRGEFWTHTGSWTALPRTGFTPTAQPLAVAGSTAVARSSARPSSSSTATSVAASLETDAYAAYRVLATAGRPLAADQGRYRVTGTTPDRLTSVLHARRPRRRRRRSCSTRALEDLSPGQTVAIVDWTDGCDMSR